MSEVPGYASTVTIQSLTSGLHWQLVELRAMGEQAAASPATALGASVAVVASGLTAPMEATHFALSCDTRGNPGGVPTAATQAIAAGDAAHPSPLAVLARTGVSCALLTLPDLAPVRIQPIASTARRSEPAESDSQRPLPLLMADGGWHPDRLSSGSSGSSGDAPLVRADRADLVSRLRTATRFTFGSLDLSTTATAAANTPAVSRAPSVALRAHLITGGQCVALRQPIHLHTAPLTSRRCEPLLLHPVLNWSSPSAPPLGGVAAEAEGLGEVAAVAGEVDGGDAAVGTHASRTAALASARWLPPPPQLSLRIVQWNVLDGCDRAPSRLGGIGRWLIEHGADVVALNEMNGWSDVSFGQLARSWGFRYSQLLETSTGYHLALASRAPMALEFASSAAPFHHGVMLLQIGGLRVCLTHLSPRSAVQRGAEAQAILQLERQPPRRGFVLVGDLNTLSPLDADEHHASALTARLSTDAGLARKFLRLASREGQGGGGGRDGGGGGGGRPRKAKEGQVEEGQGGGGGRDGDGGGGGSIAWTGGDAVMDGAAPAEVATPSTDDTESEAPAGGLAWVIDYTPMQVLLDGGMVDAGYATSAAAAAQQSVNAGGPLADAVGQSNHSVPTLINADAMHAAAMRLDYALVNRPLAEHCAIRSWLARDAETELLSDHYPLLTEIDC